MPGEEPLVEQCHSDPLLPRSSMSSAPPRRFVGRLTWSELSGALGDLGTFVPLLLGLVREVGLDLGTTLIATGVYNVVTGIQFGIPMPVQPMKTISAVALSEDSLTIPELMAAGLSVSAIVFALGVTRGMAVFNKLVPFCLVRGIQLGVGLRLAVKGLKMVFYFPDSADWRDYLGIDGLVLGLFGLVFILITTLPLRESREREALAEDSARTWLLTRSKKWMENIRPSKTDVENNTDQSSDPSLNAETPSTVGCSLGRSRRIPSALVLVALGVVLVFASTPSIVKTLQVGPSRLEIVSPTWEEFKTGFWRGGLPQLPLTTLNSVVAVCKLSEELFPERPANPSVVASSVGAMNILGCWFGVMPCCHGAGGLAAQTKFGASSGLAPIMLGLVKIGLGLLFGSSLFTILQKFPEPLLGSMLVFSGVELATCCRSENEIRGVTVMLLTATGNFATNNTGIGFVVGAIAYTLIYAYDFLCDVFSH